MFEGCTRAPRATFEDFARFVQSSNRRRSSRIAPVDHVASRRRTAWPARSAFSADQRRPNISLSSRQSQSNITIAMYRDISARPRQTVGVDQRVRPSDTEASRKNDKWIASRPRAYALPFVLSATATLGPRWRPTPPAATCIHGSCGEMALLPTKFVPNPSRGSVSVIRAG
jgi:hypothetical protein